jgi:H+/Cl- antiporter ClcA
MRYVTDLSLFWLLPWGVISGFLAYWLYSSSTWFQELNKKWQIMLRVLRASGLFLLGVLLFGMLFEVVNYRIEKPIIIALVDGSTSMKNYKDRN